jgi:hypothetical protein
LFVNVIVSYLFGVKRRIQRHREADLATVAQRSTKRWRIGESVLVTKPRRCSHRQRQQINNNDAYQKFSEEINNKSAIDDFVAEAKIIE